MNMVEAVLDHQDRAEDRKRQVWQSTAFYIL
jgi:hypothetical protein